MATIAFLVVLCVVFRILNCLARGIARRQLDSHRVPSSRRRPARPPQRRVPPPVTQARLLLSAAELPTAAMALLAGRRSRARLRLILAMRRDQALDRYYARLGQLHDDSAIDSAIDSMAETYQRRAKKPDAFEDPAGALAVAITAMFAIPPAALGAVRTVLAGPPTTPPTTPLVVHLKPRDYGDQKIRRSWVEADYLLSPYLDGHPVGTPCGVCARENILAARQPPVADLQAEAARARVEYQRYLEHELGSEGIPESRPRMPAAPMPPASPMGLGRWTPPTYRPDDDRWLL
jgi:hypothetical protein